MNIIQNTTFGDFSPIWPNSQPLSRQWAKFKLNEAVFSPIRAAIKAEFSEPEPKDPADPKP